jgi:hypothetical protein
MAGPRLYANIRLHALLVPTFLIIAFLGAYLFSTQISNLFSLFCFGALGGTLNTYFRLKDLPADAVPLDSHSNILAILQVYVSPIVAGAFATVMYVVLVSKVIEGPLFPQFETPQSPPDKIIDFLWRAVPDGTFNAAKLCFWAFVAGFVERLVPNIIDRIVTETKK